MKRLAVEFAAPGRVVVQEDTLPAPGEGEVLVQTVASAISAGTELLFYRGQVPPGMAVDAGIETLAGRVRYPLRYGYAAVGQVAELGPGVDGGWAGQTVFAFNPHESAFLARPAQLQRVPGDLTPEEAVFLPNAETAVTLVLDGAPLLGERVVVFGQGVVGLLTTGALVQFPLDDLVTLDSYAPRRALSLQLGASASLDASDPDTPDALRARLHTGAGEAGGADLAYELSGAPQALDQAIAVTGYAGRVVIGSWYGDKPVPLALGGHFHRSRMRLISSQVSSIAPALRGRWDSARRFEAAWALIRQVQPQQFITHRIPATHAAEAFWLLANSPADALQVVFTYP